jgi:site-specific recombinase XerD
MQDVRKCQSTKASPGLSLEFAKAFKSFLGYLEGTEKSAHTIKSYRLDVLSFHEFLVKHYGRSPIQTASLSASDLEQYHEYLQSAAQKTNTRRRKLLTAHRFLRYLSRRNQLEGEIPIKLPAPHKVERVPFTVPRDQLLEAIRALPAETTLDRRNRAMLWLLAETGCLVSEIGLLQFEQFQARELAMPGKASRKLTLSEDLSQEISSLRDDIRKHVFMGFNRHGPLKEPISSRGVELLVRFYAARLGFPELTPRTFRHSVVLAWFQESVPQAEIQRRLGLKTSYAFRTFAPLLEELRAKT